MSAAPLLWSRLRAVLRHRPRLRPGRRPTAAALLLLVSCAAACSDRSTPGRTAGEEFTYAPAYRAFTLAGDTVDLAAFRGQTVLLNLWATWCPPCRAEMPSLQRVHQAYGPKGLHVVGVSLDNGQARAAIEKFIAQYGVTFTILHDPHDAATDVFRTFGLPETFLIAPDGRLLHRWRGKVDADGRAFRKVLEKALAAGR